MCSLPRSVLNPVPGCAHLHTIKILHREKFLAPKLFVPRHYTSDHLSHFCYQDNLSATYQNCTAIAPASKKICALTAKSTPYPPCTGIIFWPASWRVSGSCPDAASANATSLYCRAVTSNFGPTVEYLFVS